MSDGGGVTFPGARRPDRQYKVDSAGVGIAVGEWGDPAAPPLLLAHGGFDFVGTYDGFAPLLAEGGRRVVAWDQRGHGDSDRAALYSWAADLRDTLAVLDSLGDVGPVPLVGHSKGGGMLLEVAEALPHRVSHMVNLDGLPSSKAQPDRPDHERTRMLSGELAGWLDHRRASAGKQRRPGTIDDLARRRGAHEPPPARGMAPLPGDGRRVRGRGRLALEDRPRPAHGRLRPLATGVVPRSAFPVCGCRSSGSWPSSPR